MSLLLSHYALLSRCLTFSPPPPPLTHPDTCSYDYHDNYAVHLWTSADPNKQQYLRTLSIRDLFTGGGSFQRVARQLLVDAYSRQQLCPYAHEQVRYFTEDSESGAKRDWKATRAPR